MPTHDEIESPIVECVPNFSEGRDSHIIQSIANEIDTVPNLKVLDIHSDADHNRSVITFIGSPEAVAEGAIAGVRAAARLIDLNRHEGVHPRLGAADVIPIVPIRDIDMEECVRLARSIGESIWKELGIPAYLYGYAALRDDRRNLEKIRLKGFEQMRELVMTDPSKRPDFGESKLHPNAGASIVGARYLLIAFNVDLKSTDLEAARAIASAIRARDGGLKGVKAIGLELSSRSYVQVSTNITRTDLVSPLAVFERVEEEASKRGIEILRGELVGLMPLQAVTSSLKRGIRLDSFEPDRIIEFNL